MNIKTNRLINQKSPYLLQHAYNPVDWFPWSDEAFEIAQKEDKPVFLSIGYSTCHWCHVMEKESFEDPEVAAMMNDTFVNIKLDREERPDIDHIYMSVCQLVNGSGGWPLTIIMTPGKLPFLAGTYFPKSSRMNRIGMIELIPKIKDAWQNSRDRLLNSAEQIYSALLSSPYTDSESEIVPEMLHKGFRHLEERFDTEYGGFGLSPKFPTPQNLLFLNRYAYFYNNDDALKMSETTLMKMRLGGIYDHIGSGFHRYSTDKNWLLPHFEKMLYDQATISYAFIELYQITKNIFFKDTVYEIFRYVSDNLTDASGGFLSAEDADSDGEEGKFYLWTQEEIKSVLGPDSEEIISLFNISPEGNFTDPFKGEQDGLNIFHLKEKIPEDLKEKINSLTNRLHIEREKRIHPSKDDKILTDWNGLMIASLAKGYRVFREKKFLDSAVNAVTFIRKNLVTENNKLLHRYRDGDAAFEATLDDYAFLIYGLNELYFATYNREYLDFALSLNATMIKYFHDDEKGGFFITSSDGEKVLLRPKDIYDGAIPSGNSVALLNLLRLGHLTGNYTLTEYADKLIRAFHGQISQSPSSYAFFLTGLSLYLNKTYEIVVLGEREDPKTGEILGYLENNYFPNVILNFIPAGKDVSDIFPFTKDFRKINNETTIYVCSDFKCNLPTNSIDKLKDLISAKS
ncbi:MAG: thioredoxin domain-containing protein [Ignavibacteriaceae bacterium]